MRYPIRLAVLIVGVCLRTHSAPASSTLRDGGLKGAAAIAEPLVILNSNQVEVLRAAPGSRVVLTWASRRVVDYVLSIEHRHLLGVDEDGDGRVVFEIAGGVPPDSLWIAADLSAGAFATARGSGSTFERLERRRSGLRAVAGVMNRLDVAGQYVDVTWIRPGVGAWTMSVGDGGNGDEDGRTNGFATSNVEQMIPIQGQTTATPKHVLPGDLLFFIDTRNAEWSVVGEPR